MSKSYTIGIAGYMGAGKSTCTRYLAEALAPDVEVIDADAEAKRLMLSDPVIIRALADAFGASVIKNKALDFTELGALSFANAQNLCRLNGIVHPKVIAFIQQRLTDSRHKYCICDAALIPQWNMEHLFNMCIWVSSAGEIRYARLAEKVRLPEGQLRKRMELQETIMEEPGLLPWRIIANNGADASLFTQQLAQLLKEIRQVDSHAA
jgi:dephospho-CoA kinase